MGPQLSGNKNRVSCSSICVPCESASGLLDQDPFCVAQTPVVIFFFFSFCDSIAQVFSVGRFYDEK